MPESSPKRVLWVVAAVVWFCAPIIASADSVTLISVEDATISENNPDVAQGDVYAIISGTDGPDQGTLRNRALLKFDLGANIPSNAIVTSATLTLTMVKTPRADSLWFSLHKVLLDWSENAVTWTNRVTPPSPWSAPGGVPPMDYSSLITQSNLIFGSTVPTGFTFVSNPGMVADVQDWVSNPTNNFGWILICESEALERTKRFFASSENVNTTNRPSLEVQFTLPAISPTLTLLPQSNGQFQFQFNAASNRNYTAEYCGDLITANWSVLTNITSLPAPANILVSDPLLTESNRFYRVRTP